MCHWQLKNKLNSESKKYHKTTKIYIFGKVPRKQDIKKNKNAKPQNK